ncbi:MAG: TetR family transcriptional regulator C-terminal domain-containing protein [Ilumatobacteraceae bacterium]
MKKPTVEERRAEILETTCEVVIERGFAATRIGDVAKRLGVSSSLIHYHFDSKEQLLAEAFSHYARKDLAELEAEVHAAPTAIGQLDHAIHNYVPEGSDDVEWMLWIDGWGEALRNPMMKKISQELDEQSAEMLQRVINFGVDNGEFVCPDPRASAMRLTALVDGLAIQFAAHDGMMDRDQLIGHVRSLAAWEVGIDPGAFASFESGPPTSSAIPAPATDAALRRLVARYCDGVIRGDVGTWASTWAVDATWQIGQTPVEGKAAIVAAWKKAMAAYEWVVQSAPQMVFEVDEVRGVGSGRVTVHERSKRSTGKSATLLGTYHDTYVRDGGEWLFASRTLQIIEVT